MTRDFPTIQILPLAATWMDLEIIIPSKISQEEKEELSCDIPLYVEPKIWYEWTFLFLKTKQKQTHKDRKQIYGYQGKGSWEEKIGSVGLTYTHYYIYTYIGEGNGTPLQGSCLENPMDGGAWWAAVHRVAKSRTRLSDFTFTFHFHILEKETATHSSVLAWRIPGTGKPDGLPSMGSHRVQHDWSDLVAAAYIYIYRYRYRYKIDKQ